MKHILCGLLAALCLLAPARALELSAPSALLMEQETGAVLFEKDPHAPLPPASVTKIMTILLTMEALDRGQLQPDQLIAASAHACSMGGSQIWLKEREVLPVTDLLKAVCVVSANDCAVALAEAIAGSEEAFVDLMNRRAGELGMADTHFVNATGLPAEGHLSSAHDIALMSRELMLHHPQIRDYTTIWMDTLRGGASSLVNTNKLIRFYPGATGLKTGSTEAARYCLSATAEREGMGLIAVVLKAPTSKDRFDDARTLLDHGFATHALVRLSPEPASVPVTLGSAPAVEAVLGEQDALLVEKGQAGSLTQTLQLPESLAAPVEAGQPIGTLTVSCQGRTLATVPLVARETVPRLTYGQLVLRLLNRTFGNFGKSFP